MSTLCRYRELLVGRRIKVAPSRSDGLYAPEDLAGATYDVEARESLATHDELVAKLKARKLMPSDLVFSDGIWRPFSEAREFYESCEGLTDTRALGLKARAIFWGVVTFIGLVAFYWATRPHY